MEHPISKADFSADKSEPGTLVTIKLEPGGFSFEWPDAIRKVRADWPQMREVVKDVADSMLVSFDKALEVERQLKSAGQN